MDTEKLKHESAIMARHFAMLLAYHERLLTADESEVNRAVARELCKCILNSRTLHFIRAVDAPEFMERNGWSDAAEIHPDKLEAKARDIQRRCSGTNSFGGDVANVFDVLSAMNETLQKLAASVARLEGENGTGSERMGEACASRFVVRVGR
jgi:hypothetical protein